jgi:hypothetical protein
MIKATKFIAENKCGGCCLSCSNDLCESHESNRFCLSCENPQCTNSKVFVGCNYNCFDCKMKNCINHQCFTINEFLKNC